jgi:AraC-like DNA-binding protein
VFAAKFTPGGLHPFLAVGASVSTFTDTVVSAHEVFGRAIDALECAIAVERDDATRIAMLEAFLRGRAPRRDPAAERVTAIIYAVAEDRSILQVEDLVVRHGLNKRTLQRLFAKYAGVSPKWVIQRYRLHEAAERLGAAPATSQSALALELGYSDQAHFVRDFKALAGTTPAQYARAVRRQLTPADDTPGPSAARRSRTAPR